MYVYKNKFTVIENFTMVKVDEGIVIEFDIDELNEASDYHYGKRYGEFLVEAKELLEQFCKVSGIKLNGVVENEHVKFSIGDVMYSFNAIENYCDTKRKYGLLFVIRAGIDNRLSNNKILISESLIGEFIDVVNANSKSDPGGC